MATDTTALTELVNSEWINPAILDYAIDYAVAAPFCNLADLRGKATKVGAFPRWVLDTATDITNETTALSATDLETTEVTITAAEIGIRRDVTDAVLEAVRRSVPERFADMNADAFRRGFDLTANAAGRATA